MRERGFEVGICGTFDVANYGDLLFPLIAESELGERLGAVTLHRFSYHGRKPPEWPYEVTSVTSLPHLIHRLDGLLIGGGFLIRFDKAIADGYAPPAPEIHHPTGYWLTPALMALQNDVPLVWNAPGMHCNNIPRWARPLTEMALTLSRYVSVRDEPSRVTLESLIGAPVAVVPDTAFRLPRLLNLQERPSAEFLRVCEAARLDTPYIVLQATPSLEGFVRFIRNHAERLRHLRFLVLPIGPVLGDRQESIASDLPGVVRLAEWPSPLVIAELIGRSEAVAGHSYHLFITALASGVPVFTQQDLSAGKYSALQNFDTVFALPSNGEPEIDWFLQRLGRTRPTAAARAKYKSLSDHWDRIAAAIQDKSPPTAPALNRFWQSLPVLMEDAATREDEAIAALARQRAEAATHLREAVATAGRACAAIKAREDETLRLLDDARRDRAVTRMQLDEALAQLDAARRDAAERQGRLHDAIRELTAVRAEAAAQDARIEDIRASISWRLTAPLRFAGRPLRKPSQRFMNLNLIRHHRLENDPYQWAAVQNLFHPEDAARLAATYPCDHFKLVSARGGEKDYEYEARALIAMGADFITDPKELSDAWQALAVDLLSAEYRDAMGALTRCDLRHAPMEVNVFHYGPGACLGPHRDLPEKLVTHVLYFNRSWNPADGGCLNILRSADAADLAAEILPLAGHSSVIVRSDKSWHAVSRVGSSSASSRRSVTVTFYRPGSVSTMWPPGENAPLHYYHAAGLR